MINANKMFRSFKPACKGLGLLIRSENNARVHLLATLVVILSGVLLELTKAEWIWVSVAIALVWIAEAFNTALERLVDLLHPGKDSRVGAVKDLGAAGVLLAALLSLIIGVMVFAPYVFLWLKEW